jgi:hypothetical protein
VRAQLELASIKLTSEMRSLKRDAILTMDPLPITEAPPPRTGQQWNHTLKIRPVDPQGQSGWAYPFGPRYQVLESLPWTSNETVRTL